MGEIRAFRVFRQHFWSMEHHALVIGQKYFGWHAGSICCVLHAVLGRVLLLVFVFCVNSQDSVTCGGFPSGHCKIVRLSRLQRRQSSHTYNIIIMPQIRDDQGRRHADFGRLGRKQLKGSLAE